MRDIALCTPFTYFVTLTLDGDKIDRYDGKQIVQRLNKWLSNRVERDKLTYILIPERHKDGAIHFHGLFNAALPVIDSGTLSKGSGRPRKPRNSREYEAMLADDWHIVYNLPKWQYGHTSAIALYGDYGAAISYVCKYIGKQGDKIGGRYYYSGGDLVYPVISYFDGDFDEAKAQPNAYTFSIDGLDIEYVQYDIPLPDDARARIAAGLAYEFAQIPDPVPET